MEKSVTEAKTRSPEEKIWIAVIQQKFEDARNWFYTKDCAMTCDCVGTTRDHILKLYNTLSTRYKSGHITKDELRFAIRKLELKI